jgi:hypothetical protein
MPRQEVQNGIAPTDVEVYVQGHRGPDPSQPDQLCTQVAKDRLVSSLLSLIYFCSFVKQSFK